MNTHHASKVDFEYTFLNNLKDESLFAVIKKLFILITP